MFPLEDEHQSPLSSLNRALKKLCVNHSLFTSNDEGNIDEEPVLRATSICSLIEQYLIPVLIAQCRIVDLHVFVTCLSKFDVMEHLSCMNHFLLLSPTSQFITTFGLSLFEADVQKSFSCDAGFRIENISFMKSLDRAKNLCNFTSINHAECVKIVQRSDVNMDECGLLKNFEFLYSVPSSINGIFADVTLVGNVSRFLLRLSILQAKCNYLWVEMKSSSKSCANWIISREIHVAMYKIRKLLQGLIDFSVYGIRVLQLGVKNHLRDNWWQGLSCIKRMVKFYFYNLPRHLFVESYEPSVETDTRISYIINNLISSCELGVASVHKVVTSYVYNLSDTLQLQKCMKKVENLKETLLEIRDVSDCNEYFFEALLSYLCGI